MVLMAGNYTTVSKLGAGSYSDVYKAYYKNKKDEFVAIKVVEKAKLSTAGKDNIITEIGLMKLLKHKHIIQMIDFNWDDKYIYIILEYCDGGDLSHFIKSKRKLPERICKKFLQQLAVGLKFLRSHNISHLDLKPQNLLLVTKPQLQLKIGDFGFAQLLSDAVQQNSIRGSPLYMAPEMLLSTTYDARADLWSVGIIAYECLFGSAPYSSNSYVELFNRVKSKLPIHIPNDGLSKDCRNFLSGLLKHDPNCRMTYEEFFTNKFLDLEHFPSEESYRKALILVKNAVEFDKSENYVEAFNSYCEALLYFLPILNDETDPNKRTLLHSKISDYTNRAEQLKTALKPLENSDEPDGKIIQDVTKTVPKTTKINSQQNLFSLCANTPNLKSALEIGQTAQMYLVEGRYQLALDKFTCCLDLLMRLATSEPAGIRRDLLYKQVEDWLKQAESAKALLSLNQQTEQTSEISNKEMCLIQ